MGVLAAASSGALQPPAPRSVRQIENTRRDEIAALDDADRDRRSQTDRIGWTFRRRRGAAQQEFLPSTQNRGARAVGGNPGQFRQAGFDWQQRRRAPLGGFAQDLQAVTAIDPKRSHASAPEQHDMAVTTQRPTQIARDRPDIGALAAFGLENGLIRLARG